MGFGVPHASLGEEVAAAVVLRDGASVTEQALKAFARANLSDFKVPRRIFFRDALPSTPTGKPDVRKLAEECAALLDAERDETATPGNRALRSTSRWYRALASRSERTRRARRRFLL